MVENPNYNASKNVSLRLSSPRSGGRVRIILSLTLYPALFSASPSEEDDAVNADMTSHARHCIVRRMQSVSDEEVPETAPYLLNPLLDNLRSIAATDATS